ncbi:Ion channel [Pseudoruegeria aquimaris]|uniref:Ion channel n=1 Tax=Pseudoruegeria aquimaris TaxID=393663 RepID=A0A1Y5S221_9RHOB|nr:potassium channel family protein [Pseudoruegeria aquimaris]SLN30683.1 Ion channel [Pseudoruegeria aquimaris]
MLNQLVWGSAILAACAVIHVTFIVWAVPVTIHISHRVQRLRPMLRLSLLVGGSFLFLVLAHTVQVWLWAFALRHMGAIETMTDAVYFSLVTYTTLGYGDIVLDPGHRIFGAFASVTGLLTFGVSTAFLVSLMSRVLPDAFGEEARPIHPRAKAPDAGL